MIPVDMRRPEEKEDLQVDEDVSQEALRRSRCRNLHIPLFKKQVGKRLPAFFVK